MKHQKSRPLTLACLGAALSIGSFPAFAEPGAAPMPLHDKGMMPMGGIEHGGHPGMMGDMDHSGHAGAMVQMAHDDHDMSQMKSKMHEMMSEMASEADERIGELKHKLKITAAQMPLWDAFAEALRTAAKSIETMHKDMMAADAPPPPPPPPPAPEATGDKNFPDIGAVKKLIVAPPPPPPMAAAETLLARLEKHEKMLDAHLATLKAIKASLDPLYAVLTPDQKKIADGLMVGPMGVM